ncbi:MAG: peptidylprolyl isomerase [Pseudomonadota bacterium]
MKTAENGLFISIEYTGTLENGEVFDSSKGRQPLEVEMGAGQVIPGFEEAISGMALNEKKVFTVQPEQAYGPRNEEHIHTFSRSELPPEMDPEIGQTIALTTPDGQQIPAWIAGKDEEGLTVDLNHPLAGKALTFSIEITGISETSSQQSGCGCGCESDSSCSSGCC